MRKKCIAFLQLSKFAILTRQIERFVSFDLLPRNHRFRGFPPAKENVAHFLKLRSAAAKT